MHYHPHWLTVFNISAALVCFLQTCLVIQHVLEDGSLESNALYTEDFPLPGDVIPHHYSLSVNTYSDLTTYSEETNDLRVQVFQSVAKSFPMGHALASNFIQTDAKKMQKQLVKQHQSSLYEYKLPLMVTVQ